MEMNYSKKKESSSEKNYIIYSPTIFKSNLISFNIKDLFKNYILVHIFQNELLWVSKPCRLYTERFYSPESKKKPATSNKSVDDRSSTLFAGDWWIFFTWWLRWLGRLLTSKFDSSEYTHQLLASSFRSI